MNEGDEIFNSYIDFIQENKREMLTKIKVLRTALAIRIAYQMLLHRKKEQFRSAITFM